MSILLTKNDIDKIVSGESVVVNKQFINVKNENLTYRLEYQDKQARWWSGEGVLYTLSKQNLDEAIKAMLETHFSTSIDFRTRIVDEADSMTVVVLENNELDINREYFKVKSIDVDSIIKFHSGNLKYNFL